MSACSDSVKYCHSVPVLGWKNFSHVVDVRVARALGADERVLAVQQLVVDHHDAVAPLAVRRIAGRAVDRDLRAAQRRHQDLLQQRRPPSRSRCSCRSGSAASPAASSPWPGTRGGRARPTRRRRPAARPGSGRTSRARSAWSCRSSGTARTPCRRPRGSSDRRWSACRPGPAALPGHRRRARRRPRRLPNIFLILPPMPALRLAGRPSRAATRP